MGNQSPGFLDRTIEQPRFHQCWVTPWRWRRDHGRQADGIDFLGTRVVA